MTASLDGVAIFSFQSFENCATVDCGWPIYYSHYGQSKCCNLDFVGSGRHLFSSGLCSCEVNHVFCWKEGLMLTISLVYWLYSQIYSATGLFSFILFKLLLVSHKKCVGTCGGITLTEHFYYRSSCKVWLLLRWSWSFVSLTLLLLWELFSPDYRTWPLVCYCIAVSMHYLTLSYTVIQP